ncbi:hypothetical protein [Moorena sp. SIO3H5]|uniref:hypothetical protein n=1 Tax=Moorena sp. SIO3H5 TaxID=2607834 RepID=UPI0013B7AAAE|nr:hypothetical protein [Moorena sp. SIO3H5]NEO71323.1 hypothetical protein [Moorena sp. SIO3H5]
MSDCRGFPHERLHQEASQLLLYTAKTQAEAISIGSGSMLLWSRYGNESTGLAGWSAQENLRGSVGRKQRS